MFHIDSCIPVWSPCFLDKALFHELALKFSYQLENTFLGIFYGFIVTFDKFPALSIKEN